MKVRPPRLSPGRRLAIYSPSSPAVARYPERTDRAVAALRDLGFEVAVPPAASCADGYTAGSPAKRADALNALFADERVDGIVCAIGGFNSNDTVAMLDYELIAAHPKVFVGYSDATALLLAIHAKTSLITFHGPALLPEWGEYPAPMTYTRESFLAVTGSTSGVHHYAPARAWTNEFVPWGTNEETRGRSANRPGGWTCVRKGSARGRLVGGNIETLNMLVGSPFCPSFDDALLFIEATAEEASLPRIDRALRHLDLAGLTCKIRALLVARCPDAHQEDGITLEMMVARFGERHDIPVATNIDFGHTDPMLTLPIGVEATFSCDSDAVYLSLLEPAVRNPVR